MKKHYIFSAFIMMLFSMQVIAQRYVPIPASSDPTMPTDIFPFIMGDTTATGERIDNNTIYQLENGKVYIISDRMVNKPEWDLQIEAMDLEDTETKPIITRIPNASGTYPDMMRPEGNVTLRNLWMIVGEKGPLEQHDWGKIRFMGANTRIIADHCILEKDRGGFFQIRGENVKLYITNCILRNGGNRRIIQGNGRGVDARDTSLDTLVMRNTIVHNIQDRFFRSQGADDPHNYVEIDHCTAFNVVGRHGFIQLGRVLTAKITNNLFINPIMLGSSPVYTNEQTQPDNGLHKVITLDTLYDNTDLSISNNNIFWTEDVTSYWASNDSVSAPGILSDLVAQSLGADAGDAYFQEPLTLNNVPGTILEYVTDLYANPAAEDMFDFIVEDVLLDGTPFDSGNLFDFSEFDPCYSPDAQSATAGTDGGAIGATAFCPELTDLFEVEVDESLVLEVFPNPASTYLNVTFELERSSAINLYVMDLRGSILTTLLQGSLPSGSHAFNYNLTDHQLSKGIYFLTLQTSDGIMTKKVVIQ
jgi:hypothetical protein